MTLDVSAAFAAKNALAVKKPVYSVHFDGEIINYVTSDRARALGAELMTNGDNETTAATLDAEDFSSNASYAQDAGEAYDGSNSAKITRTAPGNGAFYHAFYDGNLSTIVSTAPHRVRARVFLPNGQTMTTVKITKYDGTGSEIDVQNITATDEWVEVDFYLKPVSAFGLYFKGQTADQNEYFYVDALSVQPISQKPYIKAISGLGQSITPEEGQSSFGEMIITIIDKKVAGKYEITELLGNDATNLQRKKTIITGGYEDMEEEDMATLMTGWITDIRMVSGGEGYEIIVTDPLKWLQRKIFRGSEQTPVILVGNPMNIMLNVLTSTGAGTNGDYDWQAAENGLGMDADRINVSHIEAERDKWFHGLYFEFEIKKRRTAKDFLENEIFKVLNIYPIVKGDGTFDIKVLRPALPEEWGVTQEFDEDTIIGLPSWDQNMKGLINEVEISYDYDADDGEFDTIDFFINGTSVDSRGPGNTPIEIESRGLRSSYGGANVAARRSRRIFARYANPPPILKFATLFSRQLSEVGDVVPVTHSKLPNLAEGTRGIIEHYMEIIKRDIDWLKGRCKFTALYTAFMRKQYAIISPSGIVASGASGTVFTLQSGQGAKFQASWIIDIHYANMVAVATNLAITDISGDQITVSPSIGATPQAGWIINFSSYDNCTAAQTAFYGFLCDSGNKLGAADDDPHYIY